MQLRIEKHTGKVDKHMDKCLTNKELFYIMIT